MNYYRLTAGITETSFSIAHYSILLRYNCNHFWAMSVSDEGCHGNASCALNTISTFLFQNMNLNKTHRQHIVILLPFNIK
jgi:hypothetical protein